LNHILKGSLDEFQDNPNEIEEDENKNKTRNKGFTRCKVLILTPYKRDGYEVVHFFLIL